ncbi:MAG: glutathione S-transferase family protein [Solirubrobacteraceae bacterium]
MSATDAKPKLYVISGSHACATAVLMLAHKRLDYQLVRLPTGVHPFAVRALGFPGHKQAIRKVQGQTGRSLALLDRLGTVPALRVGSERVQTNRRIARFLDEMQPEPALFPADPQRRQEVEAAEAWGDEVFQMTARRLGLDNFHDRGNSGRLGALLSPSERLRVLSARGVTANAFKANAKVEEELVRELPPLLDRIDRWIDDGVLGGEQLNAADYMIAPSIALIAYRLDLRPQIEARPLGAYVERVLPEPAMSSA